jgi:AcrR family transcriptional regulator
MPRPRFERLGEARQDAILQAAAKEFARFGYEGASINRVLEAAGLSKGAFYYYFDDKADLACATFMWAYRDILAMYDRIAIPEDGAGFWTAIHRFAREGLAQMERTPYVNELASRLGHAFVNDQELAGRLQQVAAKPIAALTAILNRGQQLGAVRSDIPAPTLIAVFQAVKEALFRAYLPAGRGPTGEEFEHLMDLQIDLWHRMAAPARRRPRAAPGG